MPPFALFRTTLNYLLSTANMAFFLLSTFSEAFQYKETWRQHFTESSLRQSLKLQLERRQLPIPETIWNGDDVQASPQCVALTNNVKTHTDIVQSLYPLYACVPGWCRWVGVYSGICRAYRNILIIHKCYCVWVVRYANRDWRYSIFFLLFAGSK